MTVLRLDEGLCLHSPVAIDAATRAAIDGLGPVRAIIAPSNCHHFFVASAQRAFPGARTYGVPGLEAKRKDLRFDALLGEDPPALWAGQMEQVAIGNRLMHEVDFLHRASRTLITTDLVENFSDETPGTNALLRTWMRGAGRDLLPSFGGSRAIGSAPDLPSIGCSRGTSIAPSSPTAKCSIAIPRRSFTSRGRGYGIRDAKHTRSRAMRRGWRERPARKDRAAGGRRGSRSPSEEGATERGLDDKRSRDGFIPGTTSVERRKDETH
jgi:hypothetical protein